MDNPQAIGFIYTGLRPTLDRLIGAYQDAKELIGFYDSQGISEIMQSSLSVNANDVIENGQGGPIVPALTTAGALVTFENIRGLITQLETVNPQTGVSLIQGAMSIVPKYGT